MVAVVVLLPDDFEDVDPKVSYCVGESWSHTKLPVCASEFISLSFHSPNNPHESIHLSFLVPINPSEIGKSIYPYKHPLKQIPGNTCDQTSMLDIPYGEALSMLGGALYR